MSPAQPHDPIAALNEVLSEVIDVVQDVKQAHLKVPKSHALRSELDQLFGDLRTWVRSLIEQDEALGVSPFASMPSVAGRTPPNLWPGTVNDDEVIEVISQHLDRLEQHVSAALADQQGESQRTTLAEVEQGLLVHRRVLNELKASGT
jgi:DNA-binding ferritin-like protein